LNQGAPKKPRKGRSLGLLLDSTTPNLPPEMVTPSPISRLWGNEGLPSAHLDVSDPDTEKLDCFFAFLQEKLKWTFGELLYQSTIIIGVAYGRPTSSSSSSGVSFS
jgi:hypothetical protein